MQEKDAFIENVGRRWCRADGRDSGKGPVYLVVQLPPPTAIT